jgi:hypothetical protein
VELRDGERAQREYRCELNNSRWLIILTLRLSVRDFISGFLACDPEPDGIRESAKGYREPGIRPGLDQAISSRPKARCAAIDGARGELYRFLRAPRGPTATLGTAVKFLDDFTQAGVGFPNIVSVDVVHNLVAVVVHLHSAIRTNHFVGLSHSRRPSLRVSAQRYLLTPLP